MNKDTWKSLRLGMLGLVIVMLSLHSAGTTGAWFLDFNQWANADYQLGVINYNIQVNEKALFLDSEKEDKVDLELAVPIIGGVKIYETEEGPRRNSKQNFNEGATLARINIQNTGDFPADFAVNFTSFGALSANGICYMILPADATISTKTQMITVGGIGKTYKDYVVDELEKTGWSLSNDSSYAALKTAVENYYENYGSKTLATSSLLENTTPGAINPPIFNVNVLFFAEFDEWNKQSYNVTTSSFIDNVITASSGLLTMSILVTPPED